MLPESPVALKGWGFLCALPREGATLARRTGKVGSSWEIAADTRILISGMGAAAATVGAERLVDAGACGLVSWGTCGGLDPRLRPGDVLVATSVRDVAGQDYPVAESWRRRVEERAGVHIMSGPLVTSDTVLADIDSKQALYARWGAWAVDMESAAVAAVARRRGCPFLAIRAVIDDAQTALPRAVTASVRTDGTVAWWPFLQHLGISRRAWRDIIMLMRSAHKAERALALIARGLIEA